MLSAYYVPGTVLGSENEAVNKTKGDENRDHSLELSFFSHPLRPLYPCVRTSASSRADCSSSFSASSCLRTFSSSWMVFPLEPSCSVRSEISSVGGAGRSAGAAVVQRGARL